VGLHRPPPPKATGETPWEKALKAKARLRKANHGDETSDKPQRKVESEKIGPESSELAIANLLS
jgi:hypothetical protein